jgi:two-component system, chemotaxis family, chemotaxis protein CheY
MSKVILTVDGSLNENQMIHFTLTGAGYIVLKASGRDEAFSKLNMELIDLVIADLNTLNSGGLNLICDIHKLPQYTNIPIIVLTTETRFFNKTLYTNCGVTCWITKPYQPDKLVSLIKDALHDS